jgi:hypothetical protein
VKQSLQLLAALTDATYGSGLLGARERAAAVKTLRDMIAAPKHAREDFTRNLEDAKRVVEWAQSNAVLAFAEVEAPWSLLLPQTVAIRDDILRSSPLLLYAQVARRLDDYAGGPQRTRHEIFGSEGDTDVRALNPGLALGTLRVAPREGTHNRDEIVALADTPADLDPAAGILTQGEGNVLSHVQLLARALGIPNVLLGTNAYRKLVPHDGQQVFFIVTPGGRVVIKLASAMTEQDMAIHEEYTRNQRRTADAGLGHAGPRLHIDRDKIDLSKNMPIDLTQVRRKDSGRFCGPKAAYLGELKYLFPDEVARGIVVPFGAYYDHYQHATIALPDNPAARQVASAGERLPDFVARTYKEFFDVMVPAGTRDADLRAWIAPRLEVIRYSIRQAPLSAALKNAIRDGLDRAGLLLGDRSQTVGCFVRSDTNVEDLDNFNGAGLNLTLFNRKSVEDIYAALKEVWASPFALRSFSWRQALIDDPLWVLSSVVILESVPNDKSGVLVGGGSAIVAASGKDTVLEPTELAQITGAGRTITAKLEPVRDPAGKPRPWDIEFGFRNGKLWLFQCRPFLGNEELKNIPALAALEGPDTSAHKKDTLSLEEIIR